MGISIGQFMLTSPLVSDFTLKKRLTSDYSHFYKFNSSLELTSCLVNERIAKSQESQPAWKFRAAELKYTDCTADLVSTTIQRRDLPPNPEHSP